METNFNDFVLGIKVEVSEVYRNDEVAQFINSSDTATVLSEPSDSEELVCIQYDSKEIDFVPQDMLTPIK